MYLNFYENQISIYFVGARQIIYFSGSGWRNTGNMCV